MDDIVIKDSNGNELNYKVLLTFDMKGKSYVVYTDSNLEEDTDVNIYYAYYKNGDFSKLEPVEDEEEIAIIDDIVADFEKGLKGEL